MDHKTENITQLEIMLGDYHPQTFKVGQSISSPFGDKGQLEIAKIHNIGSAAALEFTNGEFHMLVGCPMRLLIEKKAEEPVEPEVTEPETNNRIVEPENYVRESVRKKKPSGE